MQLTLALSLPHDQLTVALARHVVRVSLAEVGVDEECLDAIELALSEACTNVLRHAGPGDLYEVSVEVNGERALATLRVVDTGHGIDNTAASGGDVDASAEQGRGIKLIRALVDEVEFTSLPQAGTVVHLEKVLDFRPGSLAVRHAAPRHPPVKEGGADRLRTP